MTKSFSKEFICSEHRFKKFKSLMEGALPTPFNQKKVKKYRIEISLVEEDYDMTFLNLIKSSIENTKLNYKHFTGSDNLPDWFLEGFYKEHLYEEKDHSGLSYFFMIGNDSNFTRRTIMNFLDEQGIEIHKDFMIPLSSGICNLIFVKDQDSYNQIKLAFSPDVKISTLWSTGI